MRHGLGARRGLTFLETIGASVILAMLAAVVFGAFNSMLAGQNRQRQRLACAEIANRLILQYLDDPTALPEPHLPVEYGVERFRWAIAVTPVQRVLANEEFFASATRRTSVTNDRHEHLRVLVWLAEESGGSAGFDPIVPHAQMGRLLDPIGMRNPDSFENIFRSPGSAAYQRFMDNIGRYSGSARQPAPAPLPSPSPSPVPRAPERRR